jgi:hypothetical protein
MKWTNVVNEPTCSVEPQLIELLLGGLDSSATSVIQATKGSLLPLLSTYQKRDEVR